MQLEGIKVLLASIYGAWSKIKDTRSEEKTGYISSTGNLLQWHLGYYKLMKLKLIF